MKMISCKTRLPDRDNDKLVYGVQHTFCIGTFSFWQVAFWNGANWCITDNLGTDNDFVDGVTHWCDLPTEFEKD